MKHFLIFFIAVFAVISANAQILPDWVEKTCRIHAYDQLIEWMKDKEFYRVSKVESIEELTSAATTKVRTLIAFDDSKGCLKREIITNCYPVDLTDMKNPIHIQILMTDCLSNPLSKSVTH